MLKQKSALTFFVNILQSILGFFSVYFVANYMGPEALGVIASAVAFVSLFSIFSDLGFGIAHVKRLSEGIDEAKCIGTFLSIKIVTTSLMLLLVLLGYFFTVYILKKPVLDPRYLPILLVILFSAVIGNFTQVIQYTFAARIEKAKESSILLTAKIVTVIGKILTAVLGFGIIFLAISNLAGAIISFILAVYLFRKFKISRPDKFTFYSYKNYAIPSMFIGVASIMTLQLDKVFIGIFAGPVEVGYYSAGQSIILTMSIISTIFISLLLPTYSRFYAENDIESIKRLASKIERYISLILMPIVFFIFFNSTLIQQLILGPKFEQTGIVLKILVLNSVLLILSQPYTIQIMGMNRVKIASLVSVSILFINIIFYIILIPDKLLGISLYGLGATGGAIALLISNAIAIIVFRIIANKLTGAKPNNSVLIHAFVALFCFGSSYFLSLNIFTSQIILLSINLFVPLTIYFLILVFLREFSRADIYYYLGFLRPTLMKNYIHDEFKANNKK